VPWSAAISRPDELHQYARACFEAHYGQSLDGWRLVVSPEAAGLARIATAVPETLLQRLHDHCRDLGLRLRSVRPYLMAAYNRFAEQLGQSDFLFVLHSARCACWRRTASGSTSAPRAAATVTPRCKR
jgi:hypothetical protein